ncbi:hypothetical protein AK830_g9803 [Neonectria ditissima]|uniref:Uncharacterized protein n=1 Tax=Neonectria ditissima TaxID=78410 RepID=A0A0P7B8G1_9HYPO|nr:hypothetical protein AK830_g9803 [Neonectria ditissima]
MTKRAQTQRERNSGARADHQRSSTSRHFDQRRNTQHANAGKQAGASDEVAAKPFPTMVYDWDVHQKTCYQLYIDEGRSLEDIMDHMKAVYKFTPSKRAFQTQFRRWNFPSKQKPAYKNDRLVNRIRELWGENLPQREMLRVLNDEDGFDIKPRELMRVRTRNRWLLRVPNGDKPKPSDPSPSMEEAYAESSPIADGDSTLSLPDDQNSPLQPILEAIAEPPSEQHDIESQTTIVDQSGKRKRRRNRQPTNATGSPCRFPSETTIDEARVILSLDPAVYRVIRSCFQRICSEEGVTKKTLAGVDRWDSVKDRLVQECPRLQQVIWGSEGDMEAKRLALDVICTDVTKRMRTMETRMSLAEAKNALGVNPEESREIRFAFHQVLRDAQFTCKSDATPREWEELKQKWAERSELIKNLATSGTDPASRKKARALEILARDVMKRMRDERSRNSVRKKETVPSLPHPEPPEHQQEQQQQQDQQLQQLQQQQQQQQQRQRELQKQQQMELQEQHHQELRKQQQQEQHQEQQQQRWLRQQQESLATPAPLATAYRASERRTSRSSPVDNSPQAEPVDLGDGMGSNNFDAMSEVSHASQMPFAPPQGPIPTHLPMSLQSQSSSLSDSPNDLPQPHRVLGSSIPTAVPLDTQIGSSLFLAANTQAAFMDQQYVQQPYAAAATSTNSVFHAVQPMPTGIAVFLRLHPSSTFVTNTGLWIATMTSQSLQELRHAAVDKFPGALCVRVEGIVKDGKGAELPLQIEDDEEMGAYLAHLQGSTPTFAVQLVWKT